MEEYQSVLVLYEKHKKQGKYIVLLSIVLMILASTIIVIDFVRIEPILLFWIMMLLVILFTFKIRIVSKNYDNLQKFLKKHNRQLLKNKELVFYMDYQLNQIYINNSKKLKADLKSKKMNQNMMMKLENIHFLFDSLSDSGK